MVDRQRNRSSLWWLFAVAHGFLIGCGSAHAGGQTGDENGGRECTISSIVPLSPKVTGPGGFSAEAALEAVRLSHPTFVTTEPGAEHRRQSAFVDVALDAFGLRVIEYHPIALDPRSDDDCTANLTANGQLMAAGAQGETLFELPLTAEFVSESYLRLRSTAPLEAIRGELGEELALAAESSAVASVELDGGVTALGSWGRVRMLRGATDGEALIAYWPRAINCTHGGVPVDEDAARTALAGLPTRFTVDVVGQGGADERQTAWRLEVDHATSCMAVALAPNERDALLVEADLHVEDLHNAQRSVLRVLLRVPHDTANPIIEHGIAIGGCATPASPEAAGLFPDACGEWGVDLSDYAGAHLDLEFTASNDSDLSGRLALYGDTSAECPTAAHTPGSVNGAPGGGSCTNVRSTVVGRFEIFASSLP